MGDMDLSWLTRFSSPSESFDANANMANISYASTAPAATTGGQGNNPVSSQLE
ncbi:hypothetical protein PENSUB_1152 [Penicillium subrubescens]|uniref:Uncharacterized protein n=1 Tax=Penicillium subrubescens TaxID=1316194 RepID=A0A1Q5UKR2_9EURO|nr:hypothetical protein PENSUB_1152 [Penicillium subrubescens]